VKRFVSRERERDGLVVRFNENM